VLDLVAGAVRARRRTLKGRFKRQRLATRELWEAHRIAWANVPPDRLFWGQFEDLAKRSTHTVKALSWPATCDFGPCWPTRASCSYMRTCASARGMRPR